MVECIKIRLVVDKKFAKKSFKEGDHIDLEEILRLKLFADEFQVIKQE